MHLETALTALAVAAVAVAALSACKSSAPSYDYVAVCLDRNTMTRMPDAYCRDSRLHPADSWGYFPPGQAVPPVNQRVTVHNTTTNIFVVPTRANGKPASIQHGGVPDSGGVVRRGGLGTPASSTTSTPASATPKPTTPSAHQRSSAARTTVPSVAVRPTRPAPTTTK